MKKIYTLYTLLCGFLAATTHGDSITVHNTIDEDVFIATYYKNGEAKRISKPIELKAYSSVSIERGKRVFNLVHPFRFFNDRELVVALDLNELAKEIAGRDFNRMFHTNVGSKYGNTFYLTRNNELLLGYNTAAWQVKNTLGEPIGKAYSNVKKLCTRSFKEKIKKTSPAILDNPYKDKIAHVRVGNELCAGEVSYLKKRRPKVKAALEKFLGHSIDDNKVPTIALLESGGGCRAMVSSIGTHVGLQKIGLLDAVTYMVGVSGSTWSMGLWIEDQSDIETFKNHITEKLKTGLADINKEEWGLIGAELSKKYAMDQEVTLVDTFGAYLANALLRNRADKRHMIHLSDQTKLLKSADYPLPIYTAVSIDHKAKQEWYEFTPWEFGSSWLGLYVPTWAYGRKFENGVSIDRAPEQSFGYILGTCGSAFAASLERMYKEVEKSMPKVNVVKRCVNATLDLFGHHRFTAAHVNNFTYGMPECRFRNYNILKVGDGGVECNLPFAAVSGERPERKADILIFMDASNDLEKKHLGQVEQYARDHNLKFPKIDCTDIDKKIISIFKDENDPTVPLVIYLPLVKDTDLVQKMSAASNLHSLAALLKDFDVQKEIKEGFASTFNFCYEGSQADQLSGLMEFNVRSLEDQIRRAIEWKMNNLE